MKKYGTLTVNDIWRYAMKKIILGLSSALLIVSSVIGMHSDAELHHGQHDRGVHPIEVGKKRTNSLPITKYEHQHVSGDMKEQFEEVTEPKTIKKSHSLPVTKKEIDEVMHILEKNDFLAISPEEAREIKSISFEGIEIDSAFVEEFYSKMYHHFDNLSFKNCTLTEGRSFSDLFDSEYPVVNFEIVNCGISIEDAGTVLSLINPYLVKRINLSGNGFEEQRSLFEREILKKRVNGIMCLDAPICGF